MLTHMPQNGVGIVVSFININIMQTEAKTYTKTDCFQHESKYREMGEK